jgi:hypothetical protein
MSQPITAQDYAMALLVEECGKILQLFGKAGRFGIDTPGPDGTSARHRLNAECGDILASVDYAIATNLLDASVLIQPEFKSIVGRFDEDYMLNTLLLACSKTALIVGETIKKSLLPERMFPEVNPSSIKIECLSLVHAIGHCERSGLLDAAVIARQRKAKLAKLLNLSGVDNRAGIS